MSEVDLKVEIRLEGDDDQSFYANPNADQSNENGDEINDDLHEDGDQLNEDNLDLLKVNLNFCFTRK